MPGSTIDFELSCRCGYVTGVFYKGGYVSGDHFDRSRWLNIRPAVDLYKREIVSLDHATAVKEPRYTPLSVLTLLQTSEDFRWYTTAVLETELAYDQDCWMGGSAYPYPGHPLSCPKCQECGIKNISPTERGMLFD